MRPIALPLGFQGAPFCQGQPCGWQSSLLLGQCHGGTGKTSILEELGRWPPSTLRESKRYDSTLQYCIAVVATDLVPAALFSYNISAIFDGEQDYDLWTTRYDPGHDRLAFRRLRAAAGDF